MKKVQYKLVRILLLSSTLPLIVIALLTVFFLERMAVNDARQRINRNLDISFSIYNRVHDQLKYVVRDMNRRVFTRLEKGQLAELRDELQAFVKKNRLHFFVLTDASGTVLVSLSNPAKEGMNMKYDYFVENALSGKVMVGTEVLTEKGLQDLGLYTQAKIEGVETKEGMVIKATLPVINASEVVIGSISSGYLLNNDSSIVLDTIKETTGFVSSIFLHRMRICSTVPSGNAERIVGSLFPVAGEKQYSADEPRGYFGKMKLGGIWYVTGYNSLYNARGHEIGMLGIGIPAQSKSLFALRNQLTQTFVMAIVISIVLSLYLGMLQGRGIVLSIGKLRDGIRAFGHGDLSFRINIKSKDELEELSHFFNRTMAQLVESHQESSALGTLLEAYKSISLIFDIDLLSDCVVKYASVLSGAEKTSLMLVDETTNELVLKSAHGLDPEALTAHVKIGKRISTLVLEKGEPVVVDDITAHSEFKHYATHGRYKTNAFVSLPLKVEDKVIGLINAADKKGSAETFSGDDLRYLQLLENQTILQMENIRLYERLSSFAVTDALTGLYNHRYFHEHLLLEILRSQRYHQPLSLIMFDVDSFKEYNDTYGHLQGDEVLKFVADVITRNMRKVDIICRYGGDEFAIILPNTGLQAALQAAEKIIRSVRKLELVNKDTKADLLVRLSGGVGEYHTGASKEDFIAWVDQALYKAKTSGKNQVCSLGER